MWFFPQKIINKLIYHVFFQIHYKRLFMKASLFDKRYKHKHKDKSVKYLLSEEKMSQINTFKEVHIMCL